MGSSPTRASCDHRLFSRMHDAKTVLVQTPEKVVGAKTVLVQTPEKVVGAKTVLVQTPEKVVGAERGKFWDPTVAVGGVGCQSGRFRGCPYRIEIRNAIQNEE